MGHFFCHKGCCTAGAEGRYMLSRRAFFSALVAAGAGTQAALSPVLAAPHGATYQGFWSKPRALKLYRKQTGEGGEFEFWRNGKYLPDGWYALMHLFRDVESGLVLQYDPAVVNLLWAVQEWAWLDMGRRYQFRLTDGARSESTNSRRVGASEKSTHKDGKAIDGSFEGLSLKIYADAALFFGVGGVGLYKSHVHIDSGPVYSKSGKRRTWS